MKTGRPILAVSGLRLESRIARSDAVGWVAAGGDGVALADAIERHIAAGAQAIVSFGVAGGLLPGLRPGTLVVAQGVRDPNGQNFAVDLAWLRAVRELLPDAASAIVAGSDRLVARARDKARLGAQTGAAAVDMESHIAARAASAHGLPFIALRAIADPAERDLPPLFDAAMDPRGKLRSARLLLALLAAPARLGPALGAARDGASALGGLVRCRRVLGHRLGCPDLDQLAPHVV